MVKFEEDDPREGVRLLKRTKQGLSEANECSERGTKETGTRVRALCKLPLLMKEGNVYRWTTNDIPVMGMAK
ncbi:2261_t:CDS:2, partial [Acaulospora colombiana]